MAVVTVVAALVALFVVVVASRPSTFHIERSIAIAAPERASSQVNDFRKWVGWSPWEQMDPSMKKTFEGAPAGGENRTFGMKAFSLVMNMDKPVGRDLERGLASLKTLSEGAN